MIRRLWQESGETSPPPIIPRRREPDETTPDFLLSGTRVPDVVHELRISRLEERVMFLESELVSQLKSQHKETVGLVARLKTTIETRPFHVFLSSLGLDGFGVVKPLPVIIRPDGDEYMASFFDANISTGGDTPQEAVSNLQSLIVDFFEDIENTPDEKLAPDMQRQKRVLLEMVCRT